MATNALDSQPSAEEFRQQKVKLRKLGRVVNELLANDPVTTRRTLEAYGINNLQTFLASSDAVDLLAIWDDKDKIYRCPQCTWELEEGVCSSGCQLEFDVDLCDDADYTSNEAFNPDRVSQPRGDTPLREDEPYFLPSFYATKPEPDGQNEYEELRRRGATRLMCETFHLEFDPDTGIIAWADGDLYDEFAGSLMQQGDFWKIMLGRRIKLDEDDPDGSAFMEALLEDALVFPIISGCKWETVEESPGIWVTRAMGIDPASGSGSDGPASSTDPGNSRERMLQEADAMLEPGYVAPALPVQTHHYEVSDAESEDERDSGMVVEEASIKEEALDDSLIDSLVNEEDDESDPGWAYDANMPDTTWLPGRATT
ncbi:hypothetical protein DFH06DRAFT_1060953, partial [Mycena polygramma]